MTHFKLLVILMLFFALVGQVYNCWPPTPNPDWKEDVQKSRTFLESIANALKERHRDADGNPLPMDTMNKFFRRFSKSSAVAGALFALVGFIFGWDDSGFSKMKKEFDKVNQGIDDLKEQLGDLAYIVEDQHALTRLYGDLKDLDEVTNTMSAALRNKKEDLKKSYNKDMIQYHITGKIRSALHGITYAVVGEPAISILSPVDTLYQKSRADWAKIDMMWKYLGGVLIQGHQAYSAACVLYEVDQGKEATHAKQVCTDKSDEYFFDLTERFNDKFEKTLSKCKCTTIIQANLKKTTMDIVRLAKDKKSHQEVANDIIDHIKDKYFWIDASVIVYDPCGGYDQHRVVCSEFEFRDYGRNWCLMLKDKPAYRNPFTDKDKLFSAEIEYNPGTNGRYWDQFFYDFLDTGLIQYKCGFSATGCFDAITDKEKMERKNYISDLAVIYSTNKVSFQSTNTEQFIAVFTETLHTYLHYIVTASFDWNYVSLAEECPSNYPYVFSFGEYCTKTHRSWFSKTYLSEDGYVACPSVPCRTRTGGGFTNREQSGSIEMFLNLNTNWSLETTLMMMTMLSVMILFLMLVLHCAYTHSTQIV